MKRLLQAVATRLGIRGTAPAQRTQPVPGPPPSGRAVPGASRAGRPVARHSTAPPDRRATDKLLEYSPQVDGDADPGEIVWTWVPYEDDPSQGKDRPVLVVGRTGNDVLGLMLSSQSDRDGQRHWFALGPGTWDREQRPSWVRLDRVLTVDADGIRREGAVLDGKRFDLIAAQLRNGYGWS
ncbi:type II toxin-antitoxin system PemK/MazF family toxin [Dactylosporangium roseum]|uniref:type II toxin-antitoxin system PemK/MazF family toxin n=1 Tax=Dactylosporangium roseum TaxID=47989 RepID=UPI0021B2A9C3|nr:type II toxin-antitoxin system PemK/MazF family toxin [Dactylosporangium roseum]